MFLLYYSATLAASEVNKLCYYLCFRFSVIKPASCDSLLSYVVGESVPEVSVRVKNEM